MRQLQKTSILLLLLCSIFINSAVAQSNYYLYVEVGEGSPMPLSESTDNSMSDNENLNALFEAYNVTQFFQSFPGSSNSEINSFYEIHLEGEFSEFKSLIDEGDYFSATYEADYPVLTAGCTNPVGINDWWIAQNWANNYALDLIDAQCAWTITTGNNIEVAVIDTDIDTSHDDLKNQLIRVVGTANGYVPGHGTWVSGMVAAETNNNKGVASIGNNTKISFYKVGSAHLWQQIWQAYLDSARIINVSWSSIGAYPNLVVLKEMVRNGTVITLGAGNTPNANFHSSYSPIDGVINVSGVEANNNHGPTGHAHNAWIDLCAPSINVSTTYPGNTYGGAWGTSFAAPQVAGTVALMRSVNPCLAPSEAENMLKHTCDTIADDSAYQGLVGAGRLNAYEAVKLAQAANSTTLDLYIKDRHDDFGVSGGYHWQATRDNSPDIWVRNQNDGLTNFQHQDPEYQIFSPVYVYVRVRNKSCDTTSFQDTLAVYWTKAASWSSWPQNWDGTQPLTGNEIGRVVVPEILPGRDTILEFQWTMLNPHIHQTWSTCLLARLEGNSVDPITVYPGRIDDDVYFNNNIAMKNITVIDNIAGIIRPNVDDVLFPPGRYMYIGNVIDQPTNFDLRLAEDNSNAESGSITDEAELRIITDQLGWSILSPYFLSNPNIEAASGPDYSFIIKASEIYLEGIEFPANTRIPIYVGFNFLTDNIGSNYSYSYDIHQFLSQTGSYLGGEHFEITRQARSMFNADAGNNVNVKLGQSTTLNADLIGEQADYNWYNSSDVLVHQGANFTVSPSTASTYKLEVTAQSDGYRDYDQVQVGVIYNWIESITPNPASEMITVHYYIHQGSSAHLMLLNSSGSFSQSYPLDLSNDVIEIDVTDLPPGAYSVILFVDGDSQESHNIIIQ